MERLLGELTEFKTQTLKRLDEIEKKVDSLQGFKWKVIGAGAVILFLLQVLK